MNTSKHMKVSTNTKRSTHFKINAQKLVKFKVMSLFKRFPFTDHSVDYLV